MLRLVLLVYFAGQMFKNYPETCITVLKIQNPEFTVSNWISI